LINKFLELFIAWVLVVIAKFGYLGIFVTMALESAAIPIPSEIVLPFSGFLAARGSLNFSLVVLTATLANLAGASILYLIGFYGGRVVLERYGKYIFIRTEEVDRVDRWFSKNQSWTMLVARLVPGVRTFSSLVIGAAEGIKFYKFLFYTFIGSLIWNLILTYAGFWAGDNWNFLHPYFQKAEVVIGVAIALGIIIFIYTHIKRRK